MPLDELTSAASALERAGQWDGAAEAYERLFARAVGERDVSAAGRALYGISKVRRSQQRLEDAAEVAELSREVAERSGLGTLVARTLNELGIVRHLQGELADAERLYGEARERARDAGDDTLVGFVYQNLGVMANTLGDLREARILYLESVAASVRSGDKTNSAMTYNNLGMVCTDLGEYLEAELYFDRGIEIAERLGETAQLARLYVNRAEPLIRNGELARARESLDRAERLLAGGSGSPTRADLERFRGVLAREAGDLRCAEHHLSRSLQIATESRLDLMRAEALEELARLRRDQGRAEQARSAALGALALFREISADRDAQRVEQLLEGWRATRRGQALTSPRA